MNHMLDAIGEALRERGRSSYSLLSQKPDYYVFAEYDGCINGRPSCMGTHKKCIAFMERTRPPHYCEWALVDSDTRRCVSFMLTPRYSGVAAKRYPDAPY